MENVNVSEILSLLSQSQLSLSQYKPLGRRIGQSVFHKKMLGLTDHLTKSVPFPRGKFGALLLAITMKDSQLELLPVRCGD